MPLSPRQIRAGQKAGAEGSWGQAHVSRLRGGGQPRACLAPTGTSLRYRLHNLETPWARLRWNNMSPTESHETNHVPANGCLLNPSSWAGGREAGRRTCWCLSAITYNKETGLCSRVTRRSVLKRWGVTDLTAVQLRLLATLLSLSLFSPPPPPEQMSSLTTFPHVHYQQHPTHTKSCTHTHRHTHVSGCSPPPDPLSPFQLVTTAASLTSLIPPETSRKSTRTESCLGLQSVFVWACACLCAALIKACQTYISLAACVSCCTLSWLCAGCWTLNTLASKIKSLWKEERPSGRYNHKIDSLHERGSN